MVARGFSHLKLGVILAFVLSAVFFLPAFSSTLTCSTACAAESLCECTVTPCDSGLLVVTNGSAERQPIGAFSVLNGKVSFYSPSKGTYYAQARCGDDLSNVLQIEAGDKPPIQTCTCTDYANIGCGMSSCPTDQMLRERTCTPSGCDTQSTCAYSSLCAGGTTSTVTTIPYNGTTPQACGDKICSSGENYLNCCTDCAGCERSSCSASTRICSAKYDLIIEMPSTIYKGSQFLLSTKSVVDRSTNKPVDAYTLCWQAYCEGNLADVLGCNKNVFSIKPEAKCVDTLTGLLSVSGTLYQYDYSVKYLTQLKISSAVFPSEYVLKAGDSRAAFSLSLTNLGSEAVELKVKSLSQGVMINSTSNKSELTFSIPAGATEKLDLYAPAVAGEYSVSIGDSTGSGEVQTQKLKVVSEASSTGAVPELILSRNPPYSIGPGGSLELVATVKNGGNAPGGFSLYAKGSAASAVSFSESQMTLSAGEEKGVSLKVSPTFSSDGKYSLSICASSDSGTEKCIPGTLEITQATGGLFDFTLSRERVEMGVEDSPVEVGVNIVSRSTLTRSVRMLFESSCPAGVITEGAFLNSSMISLESGSYSNAFKVNSIGKTVSCTLALTLSDNSGSMKKMLEVSIAPSASDVTKVADIASGAQTKISQAESELKKITAAGKDGSAVESAVSSARNALSACMAELNKRNYDSADVLCKNALDSANGALAVARYTEEAYGLEPPAGNLNTYVIAGVVVVLVGAAMLTFGRMV